MDILAVIPARGQSKRLPRKNLALLNGKPLLVHTIEQAVKSRYINKIVCSTEDDEIANIARRNGCQVITRPNRLAQDDIPTLPVIQHTLDYLWKYQHYKPLIVITLQPTSPLRTADDIDSTVKLLIDNGYDSTFSVTDAKTNGAVYVSRIYVHMEQNAMVSKGNYGYYSMPEERSIDINTQEDLEKAEAILKGVENADSGGGKVSRFVGKRGRPKKH